MPIYTTPARQGTFTRSPLVKGEPIKFCCESAGSLTSLTIAGAMQQDSVPSPDSPVMPQECGDLVESGEHSGQYAIPLSLSTTPIYLPEPLRRIGDYADSVSSDGVVTRRIKKLVLTGSETYLNDWRPISGTYGTLLSVTQNVPAGINADAICTHLQSVSYQSVYAGTIGVCGLSGTFSVAIRVPDTVATDDASFKAYLSAQYAAGTPVCVWYVLATPTTSTVTAPTLTTAKGSNTLSVDTTLQPSGVSITVPNIYPAITKIPITGTNKEVKHILDPSGNFVYKSPQYYTWDGIRKIVRAGLAPQYYPLGSIIYDNFDPSTGTAFQVVAYDNHLDPTLTAKGYTHSMTLCELLLDDVITMDAIEAFLYTNQALPAGTYKFKIPDYDSSYGGNKTYYFTSTAELPANSQLVMSWPYNQTPKTVTGYAPTASLTAMENTTAATGWNALTLAEWIDGTSPTATDLGTIAGPTTQAGTSSYGSMNHIHRARYGSNNYLQSGARQYLNSDKAANQWWKPQTMFDRPYGSRNIAGKLTKLSPSFVDVLAKPKIQSMTNSCFETKSLDGTTFSLSTNYNIQTDRLFLLAPMEIGFTTTDTTVGTLMGYYQNATNDTRIKKRKSNGNAYYWWLRTPYPSYASYVRFVNTSGALNYGTAYFSSGIPAAACIQ